MMEAITPLPHPDDDDETQVIPPPAGRAPSVWDVLAERRAEAREDRTFDLDVPGSYGLLALRLGAIDGQTQSRLTTRAQRSRSPDKDFNLSADTLIAATRAVLGRVKPDDPFGMQLDDDGEPLRVDVRLAEKFGMDSTTNAREVLRRLYAGAPSPELAITVANGQYLDWAVAMSESDDTLGE